MSDTYGTSAICVTADTPVTAICTPRCRIGQRSTPAVARRGHRRIAPPMVETTSWRECSCVPRSSEISPGIGPSCSNPARCPWWDQRRRVPPIRSHQRLPDAYSVEADIGQLKTFAGGLSEPSLAVPTPGGVIAVRPTAPSSTVSPRMPVRNEVAPPSGSAVRIPPATERVTGLVAEVVASRCPLVAVRSSTAASTCVPSMVG